MQTLIISGTIGRVDQPKQAGKSQVLNFSVAVYAGMKDGERQTQWYRCGLWGERVNSIGAKLAKGCKVVVTGQPSVSVYEGKGQINVMVDQIDLMTQAESHARGAYPGPDEIPAMPPGLDDQIPF